MKAAALALCLTLAACGVPAPSGPDKATGSTLVVPAFGAPAADPPRRPNAQMGRDYLDLVFRMESGRAVPVLSRYDGPIRVAMKGAIPPTAPGDLARLLDRLRREAGIDIAETGDETPQIVVEFIPRRQMRALVPQAACFVVPRVGSFSEYRSARRGSRTDWATLTQRERAAIFIPADTAPQEIRDCLHEELAQALGPLNDLFRLPDSVFNDDNFHSVLTGFDMLMLRVHYAPELANGMTEAEVASRIPGILDRLNPGGRDGAAWTSPDTPRSYIESIDAALGGNAGLQARLLSAEKAVGIAGQRGWRDTRAGFAWFALARLSMARSGDLALTAFLRAGEIYHADPLTGLQAAHVDVQLAAFALGSGQPAQALDIVARVVPEAMKAENAALLSTALAIRAEALAATGRDTEARRARLDSLAWGRYGFGPGAQTRAVDVAALVARKQ